MFSRALGAVAGAVRRNPGAAAAGIGAITPFFGEDSNSTMAGGEQNYRQQFEAEVAASEPQVGSAHLPMSVASRAFSTYDRTPLGHLTNMVPALNTGMPAATYQHFHNNREALASTDPETHAMAPDIEQEGWAAAPDGIGRVVADSFEPDWRRHLMNGINSIYGALEE